MFRSFVFALLIFVSPALAQQQPPPTLETRLKVQLGELVFNSAALATENEQLRAQINTLTKAISALRDKYEPKPPEPKP